MLAWLWRGLIPEVHLGLESEAETGIVMWKQLLCLVAL